MNKCDGFLQLLRAKARWMRAEVEWCGHIAEGLGIGLAARLADNMRRKQIIKEHDCPLFCKSFLELIWQGQSV
jgi:hypothetical protein